jgi:hypothetical protein
MQKIGFFTKIIFCSIAVNYTCTTEFKNVDIFWQAVLRESKKVEAPLGKIQELSYYVTS